MFYEFKKGHSKIEEALDKIVLEIEKCIDKEVIYVI